ncbi:MULTISPECIES: pilus assembly protein TadB [unclassified Exiguobacterium]|uniref:pilus assembly protein TadB n=1 Tax=unclassified Exiguobacterium TaxID=2644629 RepID=UPI001BE7A2C1|nr:MULTISPECIES: pilus assembly protein TadB [unclassified Exiguobacterium]
MEVVTTFMRDHIHLPTISIDMGSFIPMLINGLLALTVFYALANYLVYLNSERKRFHVRSGVVKKNRGVKFLQKFKSLRHIYEELELILARKGKEHIADVIFYSFVGVLAGIALIFMVFKVYVLALITPVLLSWYARKLLHEMKQDSIVMIEQLLPGTIDNFIRASTRHQDVKTILYETARASDEPIRGLLENLSNRMISRNPKDVLQEFLREHDNLWLKSFAFTLISYLEDSDKDATMDNLRILREMLEKENTGKIKSVSDRKYGIMINYVLSVVGVLVAIANVIFNPIGREFLFGSFFGLICLLGGFAAILGTVFLNVQLGKIKK